jgi:hypothetical protein
MEELKRECVNGTLENVVHPHLNPFRVTLALMRPDLASFASPL